MFRYCCLLPLEWFWLGGDVDIEGGGVEEGLEIGLADYLLGRVVFLS